MKHLKNIIITGLLIVVAILSIALFFSIEHQKTVASVYRIIGVLDTEIWGISDIEKERISTELISHGATQIKDVSKVDNSVLHPHERMLSSDQRIGAYRIEDGAGNIYILVLSWTGEGFDGFSIREADNNTVSPEDVLSNEIEIIESPAIQVSFYGAKPLFELESDNIIFYSYGYTDESERPKGQVDFLEAKNILVPQEISSDFNMEIHELTTNDMWELTGVQIYSVGSKDLMFIGKVVKNGELFATFADDLGTEGVRGFQITDMNNDGVYDLKYSHTWGSGMVRTTTEWLDLATGEVHVIESDLDDYFD